MAEGADDLTRLIHFTETLPVAFEHPLPSLNPQDVCVGLSMAALIRTAVYFKTKNAKKYRHGSEYGSARWGTAKDIEPFVDKKFENNIILTQTEFLTMNGRPPDLKYARNKNGMYIGSSGSGKTAFGMLPNLLQCHSSYVVTDPKGYISGGQRKDAFQKERFFSVCTNQMNKGRRKSRGQEKDKIHSALRASVQR